MQRSASKKNIVSPDNKSINYCYFLVEISHPEAGHVGAYLVDQAYVGNMTNSKESRLWNQISAACHDRTERSGLTHTIRACGSRDWCTDTARSNGYSLQ